MKIIRQFILTIFFVLTLVNEKVHSSEKIKIGETIPVLLEKIEDKHGEVLVSASKAQKIKGWDKLVEAY